MADEEATLGPMATPDEILRALEHGQEEQLIGCYETDQVEFKGQYHLAQPKERWELAKDVAALGNAGGGVIVVGVTTELDPDRAEDRATGLRPLPPEYFDPKQHRDIIQRWVYPRPHVDVVRHPRESKCFGSIRVSPRSEDQPYLVNRIPDEDGKLSDTGVGWPLRQGAQTSWTTVGQIHEAIRRGQVAPESDRSSTVTATPDAEIQLASAIDAIEAYMGWEDRSFVWLAAEPQRKQDVPIPGFYSADGVLGAVQHPFSLRPAGFGLTYGRFDNQDGRLVSADGDERYFEVRPDGSVFAAAAAGSFFLTRGGRFGGGQGEPAAETINPVVLTEWTYLFCRFVESSLSTRVEGPWRLAIGVRGASSRPWGLRMRRGQWNNQEFHFGGGEFAGMDTWEFSVTSQMNPGVDAYTLLRHLYELFGLEVDDLQLIENGMVNAERFRQL